MTGIDARSGSGTRPAVPGCPAAEVEHAVKRYPGVLAVDDVSFLVAAGEVRALLGKNGAGKSSLIRLLSGVETPDSGRIRIAGHELAGGGVREAATCGVATVFQELSLVPQLTIAENIFLGNWPRHRVGGLDRARAVRETRAALGLLGLDLDPTMPTGALPVAMQQMVEIARALRTGPRLLILDEPTSSLAASEVSVVLEAVRRIAAGGVGVIYVSHRLGEIRQIADSASIMRDGRLIDTVRIADVSAAQVVAMMLGKAEQADAEKAAEQPAPRGAAVLSARHLRFPPKVADASLELHVGEVLGLAGVLGSGRTEILEGLAGIRAPAGGDIAVDGRTVRNPSPRRMRCLGVGFTPENRKVDGIVPQLGVDENIVITDWRRVSRANIIAPAKVRAAAQDLIQRMAIRTTNASTPIGTLSGGNQQKAVIGRWLHARSRILLLDEPTRGVDVEAKAQIYELVRELAADGTAVLFVSSEIEELPLVCDRVLVLRDGRFIEEFSRPDISTEELLTATIAESGN